MKLSDPDKSGIPRMALTEAGLAHYRVLCKRQRRKDLVVPPPERGRTTETTETRPVAGWTSGSSDEPREAVTSSERFYVVIPSGGWRHARRVT